MDFDYEKLKEKYPLRDYVENPLDVADVLLVLMCMLLIGSVVNNADYVIGEVTTLVMNWASFLLIFSAAVLILSDIDKKKYLKAVAVIFLLIVMIFSVSADDLRTGAEADIGAFSLYSANLTLQGENPYTQSMLPAIEKFEEVNRGTPLMNGGYVGSLSYPSLSFLYLVPQVALGYQNLFFTTFLFVILTGLILVLAPEPKYSLMGGFTVHFFVNVLQFSGVEFTWLSMLLLGIWFWEPKRYVSLFFIGLSFCFKQIPWFIAPFLVIWILKENNSWKTGITEVFKQFGFLGTVFLIPNLPFMIDSGYQWLQGVFTPLSSTGTLIQLGVGFSQLSLSLKYLPNSFFTTVMLLFIFCSMAFYWLYFDEIKWVAWIMPSLILWFNYRSAGKYIMVMIPILAFVYLVKNGYTVSFDDDWRGMIPFEKG